MRKSMKQIDIERDDWWYARNTNIPRKPSLWWRFLAFIGWFK